MLAAELGPSPSVPTMSHRKWLFLGAALPVTTAIILLSLDVFDLRDLLLGWERRQFISEAKHDRVVQPPRAPPQLLPVVRPHVSRDLAVRDSAKGIPATCSGIAGYEWQSTGECPPEAEVEDREECRRAVRSMSAADTNAVPLLLDEALISRCAVNSKGEAVWRTQAARKPGTSSNISQAMCKRIVELPLFTKAWSKQSRSNRQRMRDASWSEAEFKLMKKRSIGASIAVHPPKFYAAARLLNEWASCPEAYKALAIFLVFTQKEDLELFRQAQECMNPGMPHELWTGVVAKTPKKGWSSNGQVIAAYKKWSGLTFMMDLGEDAPEYGLMMDSELVLYTYHSSKPTSKGVEGAEVDTSACEGGGAWSNLLERIRDMEASKAFPAARVSNTLTTYNFGSFKQTGKKYDRSLIASNAFLVGGKDFEQCDRPGCQAVRQQIEDCLFSWWTDLPWTNLQIAQRMVTFLASTKAPPNASSSWSNLIQPIHFTPFEYIAYQQFCMLNEGYHINDVTNLTGEAKWGSYLEDPLDGARLDELQPMWISSEALQASWNRKIPKLSMQAPPLLIFHVDHGGASILPPHAQAEKGVWEMLVLDLLAIQGRSDFNKDKIKL